MKLRKLVACVFSAILVVALTGAGNAAAGTGAAEAGLFSAASSSIVFSESGEATQNTKASPALCEKYEVVYATLDPGGGVGAVYVVNHFDNTKTGKLTDYGDYDAVLNLTDIGDLSKNSDAVSFNTEGGNFYYQGNMKGTDLPWLFDISFSLDGKKTAPAGMAGQSGKMELRISSSQNKNVDPVFYDNYMLQITVTLDAEKCKNIDAPGAVIAEAGKNKAVAYTVMPGEDADYTLRADAHDFEMDGIQISGVPYSIDMDIPDMEDKLDDLNKLPDAISDLNKGVGDLLSGTKELKEGAQKLVDGSYSIEEGLSLLGGNSGQLENASAQINGALAQITGALSGGGIDISALSDLTQLPSAFTQLASGLGGISAALVDLKNNLLLSFGALDGAINGIETFSAEDLAEFQGILNELTDVKHQDVANKLINHYMATQYLKENYNSLKQPVIFTVNSTVDALVYQIDIMIYELNGMATKSGAATAGLTGLGSLVSGLQALSNNYSTFHSGLMSYTDGVKALADNYGSFHNGLSEFNGGVGELKDGIGELKSGTNTMNKEVADLPDMLKEEIDKMKEQYLPKDFDVVSFTSPKNTNTVYVQFVMQCSGIEKPEQKIESPQESKSETIWDRLSALFTGS